MFTTTGTIASLMNDAWTGDTSAVGATRSIRRLNGTSIASASGAFPGLMKKANDCNPSPVADGRFHAIWNVLAEFAGMVAGRPVAATGGPPRGTPRVGIGRGNVVAPAGTLHP